MGAGFGPKMGPVLGHVWTSPGRNGPFCSNRPILARSGQSGPKGPFWPKRSILISPDHSGPIGPFGPFWPKWQFLAHTAPSGRIGPFWQSAFWSKWAIPTRTVHDPIPHHRRRRLCLLCLRLACRRLLFDIRIFLLLLQLVWLMGFPQSSSASVVSSSI